MVKIWNRIDWSSTGQVSYPAYNFSDVSWRRSNKPTNWTPGDTNVHLPKLPEKYYRLIFFHTFSISPSASATIKINKYYFQDFNPLNASLIDKKVIFHWIKDGGSFSSQAWRGQRSATTFIFMIISFCAASDLNHLRPLSDKNVPLKPHFLILNDIINILSCHGFILE